MRNLDFISASTSERGDAAVNPACARRVGPILQIAREKREHGLRRRCQTNLTGPTRAPLRTARARYAQHHAAGTLLLT